MNEYKRTALRRAYILIDNGTENFVCMALEAVRRRASHAGIKAACQELRQYIHAQIFPYSTLDRWQYKQGMHRYSPCADRLNWIKWMLGELE